MSAEQSDSGFADQVSALSPESLARLERIRQLATRNKPLRYRPAKKKRPAKTDGYNPADRD